MVCRLVFLSSCFLCKIRQRRNFSLLKSRTSTFYCFSCLSLTVLTAFTLNFSFLDVYINLPSYITFIRHLNIGTFFNKLQSRENTQPNLLSLVFSPIQTPLGTQLTLANFKFFLPPLTYTSQKIPNLSSICLHAAVYSRKQVIDMGSVDAFSCSV